MLKQFERETKQMKTEFSQEEVLEIAKKHEIASFAEIDGYVMKNGGWFWTGTYAEIDGKNGKAWHINNPKKIKKYDNLPLENGWYLLDELGVPIEKSSRENKKARYFIRAEKYRGFFWRGYGDFGYNNRRYVLAYGDLDCRLGVLKE